MPKADMQQQIRELQDGLQMRRHGSAADLTSVESICLFTLALRRRHGHGLEQAIARLLSVRNRDGSWPVFVGDEATGSWTTVLAVLALLAVGRGHPAVLSGVNWLLHARGRESNWFWRWKFKTVDRRVRWDPSKYGWNWIPGTTSWVIPTAFSVIALREVRKFRLYDEAQLAQRINMGVDMLLDRMCPGGGWNAGNGMAFGVPLSPYIDTTAIALLALAEHPKEHSVETSLAWLSRRLSECPSPFSIAWGILALGTFGDTGREVNERLKNASTQLTRLLGKLGSTSDICTVAVSVLALEAAEGDKVFRVKA